MRFKQAITAAIGILLLAACTQLSSVGSVVTGTSFEDKVVVAYSTVTQVRETAGVLLDQKKISSADAQHVQDSANIARKGIDTAREIHKLDPTGATAKLDSIRIGLTAISTYLATKKGT